MRHQQRRGGAGCHPCGAAAGEQGQDGGGEWQGGGGVSQAVCTLTLLLLGCCAGDAWFQELVWSPQQSRHVRRHVPMIACHAAADTIPARAPAQVVLPSFGERYLSTVLFNHIWGR